jgi:hypothetical protein
MELKYSQISQLSNFSNDKMVGLLKEKIAESENASLALVFDDKMVILDEEKDQFYMVDYNIKDRALNLTNWEKINLIPDNNTRLESLSNDYFNPLNEKEITINDLVGAFKLKYSSEPMKQLVNESSRIKKGIVESNAKIKAIKELRKIRSYFKDDISEILEDLKIKSLKEEITRRSPTQSMISRIDFTNSISVGLFEEKCDKPITTKAKEKNQTRSDNIKKKVKNLWTSESFKNEFDKLIKASNDAENKKQVFEKFLEQHKELLILTEQEFEDLILKTALMSSNAKDSEDIVENFVAVYKLDKFQEAKNEFIERNKLVNEAKDPDEDEDDDEDEDEDEENDKKDKKTKKEKSDETSIDEDTINKFIKVFDKIKDQLKEKTLEHKYVSRLIESLEDAKVGSISEGKLKEIIDFLDSVYLKAKEDSDEEVA